MQKKNLKKRKTFLNNICYVIRDNYYKILVKQIIMFTFLILKNFSKIYAH